MEDVQFHSILLVSRYQSHSIVFLVIQRTLYLRRQQRSKQFFLGISKAFLVLSFMDSTFPVTFLKLFCVKVSSCFVFQNLVEFSINYIKSFDAIICKLWEINDATFVLPSLLQICSKLNDKSLLTERIIVYIWRICDSLNLLGRPQMEYFSQLDSLFWIFSFFPSSN